LRWLGLHGLLLLMCGGMEIDAADGSTAWSSAAFVFMFCPGLGGDGRLLFLDWTGRGLRCLEGAARCRFLAGWE
jgi:hypothetical protein